MELPLGGVSIDQVGDTDSHPFVSNKIPTVDFHSITQDTLSILHSPRDNGSAINLENYYETYRLIAAYLVTLDMKWNTPAAASPGKQ